MRKTYSSWKVCNASINELLAEVSKRLINEEGDVANRLKKEVEKLEVKQDIINEVVELLDTL